MCGMLCSSLLGYKELGLALFAMQKLHQKCVLTEIVHIVSRFMSATF